MEGLSYLVVVVVDTLSSGCGRLEIGTMRGQQKWAFSKWDTRNDWLGHYKHCDNRLPEQEHACYHSVAVFYVYDRVEDVG